MSETANNTKNSKPKISKLAIVSLLFGVLSLCTLGMVEPVGLCGYMSLSYVCVLFALRLSAIAGLFIGILAIVKIKKSSGMLKGKGFALVGIASAAALLILGYLDLAPRPSTPSSATQCSINLRALGKAFLIYTSDYDSTYPTDNWCDSLIMYCEVTPRTFICSSSSAKLGECSYAFNKNLAGKKIKEIPKDVVLLFETNSGKDSANKQEFLGNREFYKALSPYRMNANLLEGCRASEKVYKLRWNQVGGLEILTNENHNGNGCFVVFHSGHVEFVKTEQLEDLKWGAE